MLVEDLERLSNDELQGRSLGAFQQLALWLLGDSLDSRRLLSNFDTWILHAHVHIPHAVSLLIIAGIIGTGVIASIVSSRRSRVGRAGRSPRNTQWTRFGSPASAK